MNRDIKPESWVFKHRYANSNKDKLLVVVKFLLVPLYVISSWVEFTYKRNWQHSNLILRSFGFFLLIVILMVSGFFTNLLNLKVVSYTQIFSTLFSLFDTCMLYVLFVFVFNFLSFLFVIIIDIHLILKDAFSLAMKDNVDTWLAKLLGHKLWAGDKTYKLLDSLMQDAERIGRSKWLIVNFLKEDLDKRITIESLVAGDAVSELYTLRGENWTSHEYSQFLQKNLTHADKSIAWLVEPKDFFEELLPSYLAEVIVSIACLVGSDYIKEFESPKKFPANFDLCVFLSTLKLKSYCPFSYNDTCVYNCSCESCKIRNLQLEVNTKTRPAVVSYLWAAMYTKGLQVLSAGVKAKNNTIEVNGGKKISYHKVYKSLEQRECLVTDFYLPHILEFKNLKVTRKRYIFLGTKVKNIFYDLTQSYNLRTYFRSVAPCLDGMQIGLLQTNSPYHKLSGWRNHKNIDREIRSKSAFLKRKVRFFSDKIREDVMEFLLRWAFDLFKDSSGGESVVKGIHKGQYKGQEDNPSETEYSLDIGVYDERLLIYSCKGSSEKTRDIVSKLYPPNHQSLTSLLDDWFPKNGLIEAKEVIDEFIRALKR